MVILYILLVIINNGFTAIVSDGLGCFRGECELEITGERLRDTVHVYVGDNVSLLGYETEKGTLGSNLLDTYRSGFYKWIFKLGPIRYEIYCSEEDTYDKKRYNIKTVENINRRYLIIKSIQLSQSGYYIWERIYSIDPPHYLLPGKTTARIIYKVHVYVLPTPLVTLSTQNKKKINLIFERVFRNQVIAYTHSNVNGSLSLICPYINGYNNFNKDDMYWIKLNNDSRYWDSWYVYINDARDGDIWACGLKSNTLGGFISLVYIINLGNCNISNSNQNIIIYGQYNNEFIGARINNEGCEITKNSIFGPARVFEMNPRPILSEDGYDYDIIGGHYYPPCKSGAVYIVNENENFTCI